jgi:hypothetical protein
MDDSKVRQFIALAGQHPAQHLIEGDPKLRELGAQLLLSETLEYLIKGLGVIPTFDGKQITDANMLTYQASNPTSKLEMVDGLSDVAYTMFWNSVMFGIPLEEAFSLVCDNNLEKFVLIDEHFAPLGEIPQDKWHCNRNISWPKEVAQVFVIHYGQAFYAVGKDQTGKVRKPSSYQSVDLTPLLAA